MKTETWRCPLVRGLDESDDLLAERLSKRLGIKRSDLIEWRVLRRSIDARGRRAPKFQLSVAATTRAGVVRSGRGVESLREPEIRSVPRVQSDEARPVVIGMGPCGLFAAMQLAEAGMRPVLIDRGKPVETRAKDVARLMGRGEINEDSNLCFGEGGAGTWSDGKLYTRVGGPLVREVLRTIHEFGGPDRILVDARPHLGTDKLVALLKAFRAALTELGCTLRFETRVKELVVTDGQVKGVRLVDGEVIDATEVILAVGHSARDVYSQLAYAGVAMETKPFAVGYRVEHEQRFVDSCQYGEQWAEHPELPAAYYELKAQVGRAAQPRGAYSFCMCPGGSIVPTPTYEGGICVNGMSHAARSGRYANSAVVVQLDVADMAPFARDDSATERLLAGVRFQEAAEAAAWERGGGAFVAPGQRVSDFVVGRASTEVRRTTYKRGVQAADLHGIYPQPITDALVAAMGQFDSGMPGYISDSGILVGVETRTSAPLRVLRDSESLESPSVAGLYPAGEGAGYGGGIVSAAIDGVRVADRVIGRYV